MKNIFKLFGIIAIVAVIGFSFVACDEEVEEDDSSTSGRLTITGLSSYNGWKIQSVSPPIDLTTYEQASDLGVTNNNNKDQTEVTINGDSVTYYVWKTSKKALTDHNWHWKNYNGNDQNVVFNVWILNRNTNNDVK